MKVMLSSNQNACFLGLSNETIYEYLCSEYGSDNVFIYIYNSLTSKLHKKNEISKLANQKVIFTDKNYGNIVHGMLYDDYYDKDLNNNKIRTNQNLIKIAEKNKENIIVVEVPDDLDYTININPHTMLEDIYVLYKREDEK